METVIAALVTGLLGFLGAWLVHKREAKKDRSATELAVEAISLDLNERMRKHVDFVERRMERERRYFEEELERERQGCDDKISELAGSVAFLSREVAAAKAAGYIPGGPGAGMGKRS